jgi:hypothetical protein
MPALETKNLSLETIALDDAEDLQCLLSMAENARLFKLLYGKPCEGGLAHLRYVVMSHLHDPSEHGAAYTVRSKSSGQAIGWAVTRLGSDATDSTFRAWIFLHKTRRELTIAETAYLLARYCFENTDCRSMIYRTGTLSDNRRSYTAPGSSLSIDGILWRQ